MKRGFEVLTCVLVLALIIFVSIAVHSPRYEPSEGIWVCEELQLQLGYNQPGQTFIVKNGETIRCGCGSDRGVKQIQVYCQEWDHPIYELGEMIFCADIKKLTDNTLTVFDPISKCEYIFIRTDINS